MIQIYLEFQNDEIQPLFFELLGKAQELSSQIYKTYKSKIILFSPRPLSEKNKDELLDYGIEKVYYLEGIDGKGDYHFYYDIVAEAFSKTLEISYEIDKVRIVLLANTHEGRILAPALGVLKNTGITAECTDLYLDEQGKLIQVRPAFSQDLLAEIITPYTSLQIATVHNSVFIKPKKIERKKIQYIPIGVDKVSKLKILDVFPLVKKSEFQDIINSEKLVIVGNGIRNLEDLEEIKEFAKAINAQLAGTKLAIQKELLPREFQIGLSGHVVSPNLVILLGVSGSEQFLAGLRNVKKIISINKDKEANSLKIAHYPIHGDMFEIIPSVLNMLKK